MSIHEESDCFNRVASSFGDHDRWFSVYSGMDRVSKGQKMSLRELCGMRKTLIRATFMSISMYRWAPPTFRTMNPNATWRPLWRSRGTWRSVVTRWTTYTLLSTSRRTSGVILFIIGAILSVFFRLHFSRNSSFFSDFSKTNLKQKTGARFSEKFDITSFRKKGILQEIRRFRGGEGEDSPADNTP